MKKIIILTGAEARHTFMRKSIAMSGACDVIRTYCEGREQSLDARVGQDHEGVMRHHVDARAQSESDFFDAFNHFSEDRSNPVFIKKGDVNTPEVVKEIMDLQPDLLVAYGCSLIKEPLVSSYSGRFLNVHLGLSPYYRGSGTNFFPLVDGAPEFVGATFMHLDAGIDTGAIIHQIRARVCRGDSPHQIGNRLIADVARVYSELLRRFDDLVPVEPPPEPDEVRLCKRKDFTDEATHRLIEQFQNGIVERFLMNAEERCARVPLAENPVLKDALQ